MTAVAVATLVRLAVDPALGDRNPFVTYFGAVAVVAWLGRTGPAIVTLVLSGLISLYVFVPPRFSFATTEPGVLVGLASFLAIGAVVVATGHSMHVARSRAERLLAESVVRQNELQQSVMSEAEHRERLRTTLASIGDGVITTDITGRVTNLNAVAEALTGWTNQDAAGVPLTQVFNIVNESSRLQVENPALRALKDGIVVGLANHTLLIARDGTERPIDDSAAPIRHKGGEIIGAVLVFRDITERHRAETENRESQLQLATTLESVTDGFIRYDRDWRIVFVNSEAERINQLTRSEMLGKTPWELFPAIRGTKLESEFRRAVAERVTVEFDNYYEPFDRWYSLKGYPTSEGGLTTFIRDITEQKQVEQRLVESEARYRAIGESIDFGVWVCDSTGRNTYASESFLRMVGITQKQCSEFGWGDVLHPDDVEATIAAWKECVRTEGKWDRTHRFKGQDGQWHHVLARGVPLRGATGKILGWAGINLDVSRMIEAEQEIARVASESERQRRLYETVLTNTPDFVYVFSLDHKVLYANDALITMWGRGHDGAIGKTFLEIGYEPWHAEMHGREIDQVRATKLPIRGEVPFTGAHGRRMYDYIFVPVLGADGEVEAVAGTTRDVTERKETETQLREGREQLDFALAAADLGQWSLNLADRTARRSLRHDQLFGYDALLPEWTYETFLQHVVPEDRAAVDADFQRALATGSAWAFECRIRRADGAVRHIWTKALLRRDAEGRVEHMLGIVGDITDRRQAEERQAFLVRLADTLRPLSDSVDVQAEASRVLGEHLGANRVVYFEIRGDEYVVERDYAVGVEPLVGRYPVASFGQALLAQHLAGITVIEADATVEANRSPEERAAFAAIQVRGHVDVPLVKDGQFVAGMAVHVSDRREWSRQEVALIEETADRTWAAVEQVRAEAALRQSEERLRMALSAARMVAWEHDPASGAVFTSDNATDVYGFPPGEHMGSIDRGFAILHPDDVDRHRAVVAAAVAAGEGFNSQFRIVRPDTGAVQWMEEWGHAVRHGTENAVRLVGVNMDITARKEAETSLRRSEERLAFVRRSSGVGFWYCDLPFDVLDWDELVKAHFHLPPDAVVTIQTFYDRLHPDDREPTRRAIERSIAERESYNVDYRTVDPHTGAVKWIRAIGRTFYGADGTPTRFDGVTLDVSEQKRADARLRESEQRFRLMADAAPVMIWMSGTDKLVNWYNQPWLEFTGRTMEQEVGNGATEVVHPDDLDTTLPLYLAAFEARAQFSMEYRLRRHDGEYRWMICNGVPRYRADGEFDGYIGSCLDVTDYKNAQAGLRDADRRKDEFLATLAHELRNPLAPIRTGLEVLRITGTTGTADQARIMMDRQLAHLIRLVDDLLDVSRVTNGKLELRRERVELRGVIDAAVEANRLAIEQAGHELVVVLPDEPIFLDGDATRLAQVVSNLLNNSAKYTHRGGHIRLEVRRETTTAIVSVSDDGIGIPPAMLGRVFEMFIQVDRTLEKTTGGLGIGLSLVKGLVEMHGGTIEARSEGEGLGSEFVVRLPVLTSAAGVSGPRNARSDELVPSVRHRILVVDDNEDSADSLGLLLEMLGSEVHKAYDGEAGVAAAATLRPDVVLMDIGMPKLNGYEASRRIRAQNWGQDVVLVALTGWGKDCDRQQSADAGFDHHLVKPVEPSALMDVLAGLKVRRT